MSKVIAIPIETKVRELDGKLWLTKNLIAHGFTVALGKYSEIMANLDIIRPDVVFAVSAGGPQSRVELFRCLREQGVRILTLDVEGGIFQTDEGYSVRLGPEILESIDYYLAWGTRPGELVTELADFPKERVIVTGEPRFDLLNSKYRRYYIDKGREIKRQYGNYILVNTNFGHANHFDREIKESLITSDDVSRIRKPMEQFGFVEHQAELLKEFIKAVKFLAKEHADVNFIIRPHPSERHETYTYEMGGYDNVYVTAEGDVHSWLAEAMCVIHNNCTTGVEAVLLDKPAIAFSPITMDGYDLILPNKLSWNADSINELSHLIREVLAGRLLSGVRNLSNDKRQLFENYFANTDGDAAQKITDFVVEIFQESEDRASEVRVIKLPVSLKKRLRRAAYRAIGSRAAARVAGFVRGKISKKKNYVYGKQKFGGLTKEEIKTELSAMIFAKGDRASNCRELVEPINGTRNCYWCKCA
ncbi:MAG: surface carbohydrate biosynthesis protein [Chloroflexota bacterium]|nr:surface carbohydrate biosynthesis protein [Chloroflexota bacterium]